MSLAIFRHADGGHYVIVEDRDHTMKMDDGRWEPAVLYRGVERGPSGNWQYLGRRTHSTTRARWAERFESTGEMTSRAHL
jgi:hypothetical protein